MREHAVPRAGGAGAVPRSSRSIVEDTGKCARDFEGGRQLAGGGRPRKENRRREAAAFDVVREGGDDLVLTEKILEHGGVRVS
jgi:hypothetical protein